MIITVEQIDFWRNAKPETQNLEFKEAKNQFDNKKLYRYCVALANEGGLSRSDFGKIQIRPDFSLVELPADLGPEVFSALADTRISGKLIELRADNGPRGGGSRPPRGDKPAGDFDRRKPRHKKP